MQKKKVPHPLDAHIAKRMKERREELGIQKKGLGVALGVTGPQIYFREENRQRVFASTLWDTAKALNVSVTYFYEGYEGE